LWGGKPGACGDYLLRLPGETEYRSMAASHHPVPARSEVIVRTGGGGGWGDPLARDPEAVRNDVIEEFISGTSAREDYGVVLRDDRAVDVAATMQLRDIMRTAASRAG
jgi:N-methylhydantoinase B